MKELITDRANYADLTPDQRYLHDLGGLVSPILSAYRARIRLSRLSRRTGTINASSRLEDTCQRISLEAYNFKERLKLFGDSLSDILCAKSERKEISARVGSIIRKYEKENGRIIRYRNYVIHGPRGRIDEFADLRTWEISGFLLHNDLWFDYNNEFDEMRETWASLTCRLLAAMEEAVFSIQALNEKLLTEAGLSFSNSASAARVSEATTGS
ncbi:hypothetical protein LPW26_14610 [Rhodopseudomonas sp. HC1]|uniref:hypothetical protein n=1 Tax=Rhodopseudomonas infernalis TaxID=2897386 RepID=UPI001EE80A5B|nr:hypothetical protein [Rhodopseudomonas infernalis]MCG6205880.1 hypothetical protein [Rhodopseudomonas infernalis]